MGLRSFPDEVTLEGNFGGEYNLYVRPSLVRGKGFSWDNPLAGILPHISQPTINRIIILPCVLQSWHVFQVQLFLKKTMNKYFRKNPPDPVNCQSRSQLERKIPSCKKWLSRFFPKEALFIETYTDKKKKKKKINSMKGTQNLWPNSVLLRWVYLVATNTQIYPDYNCFVV